MTVIVPAYASQPCKCCESALRNDWAVWDTCLDGVVCNECRYRLLLVKEQLHMAGVRNCIQVTGGKPLPKLA